MAESKEKKVADLSTVKVTHDLLVELNNEQTRLLNSGHKKPTQGELVNKAWRYYLDHRSSNGIPQETPAPKADLEAEKGLKEPDSVPQSKQTGPIRINSSVTTSTISTVRKDTVNKSETGTGGSEWVLGLLRHLEAGVGVPEFRRLLDVYRGGEVERAGPAIPGAGTADLSDGVQEAARQSADIIRKSRGVADTSESDREAAERDRQGNSGNPAKISGGGTG